MAQTNWIKTSSNEKPKDGQSIYLFSKGTVKHATAKEFPMVRLDDSTLESINHFEYWADESILPQPESDDTKTPVDDTKKTPESDSDKKNTGK